MESPTAAAIIFGPHQHNNLISSLTNNPFIEKVIFIGESNSIPVNDLVSIESEFPFGGKCLTAALENAAGCQFVFVFSRFADIDVSDSEFSHFLENGQKQYGA